MAGLDWHSAKLEDDTVIVAGYRNTQNVRWYFKSRLGDGFAMNRSFMAWMQANEGETLRKACDVWRDMAQRQA